MNTAKLILTYDIGTSRSKTCLYSIGDKLELIDSCMAQYPLFITKDGGAEQKVNDWWSALCTSTKTILAKNKINPENISGISFAARCRDWSLWRKMGMQFETP